MNARTDNRKSSTPVTRLADYTPPAWRIDAVELEFDLDIESMVVVARLHLRCDPACEKSLHLDGEELELLGIQLDGVALDQRDHALDAHGLTVRGARDGSVLETRVRIRPADNTKLSGLYLSGSRDAGFLLTQCEAQGFRRITYFIDRPDVLARYDVMLRADAARFPMLLAGGDVVESGELPDGRRFARIVDPHPKPSYLFALVAGRLQKLERAYRTADGRDVSLRIFAEPHAIDGCGYAMDALERAMRWDERVYGRNYDLDVFNIAATDDFNMGAMENKGLNIFNAKYLLADPDITTDDEYRHIEAVIAHEYFHNWSGNRVTCRDWFQLSLKEGFTVFREQQFCADMHSAALQRIDEVALLRRVQFPEDAGPLAHPVRPAEYAAIDNFYTATVYEKGAELVRMIAGKLGAVRFRRGTDLYFARHDGSAATIEDFILALGDANDLDLSSYLAWYAQSGTPHLHASGEYDARAQTYTLTLSQHTPPMADQPDKWPLPIPVRVALFARDGSHLPLHLENESQAAADECVLELTQRTHRFVFAEVASPPVPSLLRGFSAPVQLRYEYAPKDLALLLRHELHGYDRWNAGQQLASLAFDETLAGSPNNAPLRTWLDALDELFDLDEDAIDQALLADLLTPPSAIELGARHDPLDPDAVYAVRESLETALTRRLRDRLMSRYQALHARESGSLDAPAQARRRLKARLVSLLLRDDVLVNGSLAFDQFTHAPTMTDRLSALRALTHFNAPQTEQALRDFRTRYDAKPLALDKWFALQAQVPAHATFERVRALRDDPAFDPRNPNRVSALLGTFARANPVAFHRPDGAGYRYFAARLIQIDALNPQNAARLAKSFESWQRLEPARRAQVRDVLDELSAHAGLSRDMNDVLARLRNDSLLTGD